MSEKRQNSFFAAAGYCVAASVVQFLAVPLFMIGFNPGDFAFIDISSLVLAGALLGFGAFVVLLTLCGGLWAIGKTAVAMTVAQLIFWWVLIAGFLLPVSVSAGMVDARVAGIDVQHLVIVVLLVVALTWLERTPVRQYLTIFAAVCVIYTAAVSVYAISRADIGGPQPVAANEVHESLRLSKTANIIVISFDGLQSHIVSQLLRSNEDTASSLKDFTVFANALSQSPATDASIIGELFGIRDYKLLGDSIADVKAELADGDLNEQVPLLGYDDAYQRAYLFGKQVRIRKHESTATADSIEFLKFAIARVATRIAIDNRVSNFAFEWLLQSLAQPGNDKLAAQLRNHTGPNWDKRYIAEIREFDSFVGDLVATQKPQSYRYLHFGFTHYPVDFDAKCAYRSDDSKWFHSNQNETGLANETICALSKMKVFLQKLKALHVYDNSLIVFKSDHGHPTTYFSEAPYNLRINGHELWGYSRYRPLLMVKPARARQDAIEWRDELVLLNDLAKTICMYGSGAYVPQNCDDFGGVNLMQSRNEDSGYFLYVVPTSKDSFMFGTHTVVPVISRQKDPVEVLSKSHTLSPRN